MEETFDVRFIVGGGEIVRIVAEAETETYRIAAEVEAAFITTERERERIIR